MLTLVSSVNKNLAMSLVLCRKDCATVVCPGGNPNGNSTCIQAYTHPEDNWATHGCGNNNSIVLTLCTEESSLKEVINVKPKNGAQKLHNCLS